jgi:dTDP-glucose 4,6-dehydratase
MGKTYEDCIEITEGRMLEDSIYWLNSEKIKTELGWKQTISLQKGSSENISMGEVAFYQIK